MRDRRQAVRGVTVEGLAVEAEEFIRSRPDLPWTSAFAAWRETAGLTIEREREVRIELLRRRCFQGKAS